MFNSISKATFIVFETLAFRALIWNPNCGRSWDHGNDLPFLPLAFMVRNHFQGLQIGINLIDSLEHAMAGPLGLGVGRARL